MNVLVFGTFDQLHPGHRFVLDTASGRGRLTIVIARDQTVERVKKRPPIQTEDERLRLVKQAYPEAHVLLGDAHDYLKPVQECNPDLILLGYDQTFPPGVSEEDIPCPIERLEPFHPERYKSSHLRTR